MARQFWCDICKTSHDLDNPWLDTVDETSEEK